MKLHKKKINKENYGKPETQDNISQMRAKKGCVGILIVEVNFHTRVKCKILLDSEESKAKVPKNKKGDALASSWVMTRDQALA
nr:hypothetical protein [Tanacetum cinerariifolium]